MEERDVVEVHEDGAGAEGGGGSGGPVGTGSHRAPNLGCGARRHNTR